MEVSVQLIRSSSSRTGYKGVQYNSGATHRSQPYDAKVWRNGKQHHIGSFATAEQAALAYARSPEGRLAAAKAPCAPALGAEAVEALALAEGLTLTRAANISGYRGVHVNPGVNSGRSKPYDAKISRDGKQSHLGSFSTAQEAALAHARAARVEQENKTEQRSARKEAAAEALRRRRSRPPPPVVRGYGPPAGSEGPPLPATAPLPTAPEAQLVQAVEVDSESDGGGELPIPLVQLVLLADGRFVGEAGEAAEEAASCAVGVACSPPVLGRTPIARVVRPGLVHRPSTPPPGAIAVLDSD